MPDRVRRLSAGPQANRLAGLPTESFHHDRRSIAPLEQGEPAFQRTRPPEGQPRSCLQRSAAQTTRRGL